MPHNLLLTSACNLSCDYCFAKEILGRTETSMSLDSINFIINFFKNSNRSEISLLGGEPTLHPYFCEIVDKFMDNNFSLSIKSNGLWKEYISDYLLGVPSQNISFLLNINHPSSYSIHQWKNILNNLKVISDSRIILSMNIESECFDFNYLMELAKSFNIRYIRWSFAHPIYNKHLKSIIQNHFNISEYKKVSERIIEMIELLGSYGINTLGDHSIPLCMFNNNQIDIIRNLHGELNGKCEGTLDFLPNLQVIYCLPMFTFFNKKYVYDFESLDEIQLYFESRIRPFRVISLPFPECISCDYFKNDLCHGGCLAHRTFPNNIYDSFIHEWNISYLNNKVLYLSPDIIISNNNTDYSIIHDVRNDNYFNVTSHMASLLHLFDGRSPFIELIPKIESMFGCHIFDIEDSIVSVLEKCRTFNIIRLKG